MYDVICLSHLRWDFVFQRPQHLLSRCARERRVFFIEEPLYGSAAPAVRFSSPVPGVEVITPELPLGIGPEAATRHQIALIERLVERQAISRYALWFYTPMAVPLTRHLRPETIVYDCMDELSAFKGAPPELVLRERELFSIADVVFTGGHALYEAKRRQHPNVHAFPSSVDVEHFASARTITSTPLDQAPILRPRFGFFGVIDERMDLALLEAVATARPHYQFVVIGPVAKIKESDLPRLMNIHYLGPKSYEDLPRYLAGWDVALMPFARNDATRFISPTKTPEYLAAGKPVVSTSIQDVVRTYGARGLVRIADDPADYARACDAALSESDDPSRIRHADAAIASMSWDRTWSRMAALVADAMERRNPASAGDAAVRQAIGVA